MTRTDEVREVRPVQTYHLVLPPPWRRVPLREGTQEAVQELVDRVAATTPKEIPPDQVGPRKRELVRALTERAAELREQGGLDLYVPVDSVNGFSVRTSFVVSELRPPGAGGPDEVPAVISALLEGGESATVRIAGDTWVRRERVVPGREEGGRTGDPALLLDYTVAVPGAEHLWLLVSFSCVGSDAGALDGTAALLGDLFDAIMSTWRWRYADPPLLRADLAVAEGS